MVFTTIKEHVPHCKRAQLYLCLGDKTVNYTWKSKDMKVANAENASAECVSNGDHSYAAKLPDVHNDNDFVDVDYNTIFDSQGNWQSKHKRIIINVMDTYRISHEAYHELRLAGKGHFPPLHHIMKEKYVMSDTIPYTKHPTVSNNSMLYTITCQMFSHDWSTHF